MHSGKYGWAASACLLTLWLLQSVYADIALTVGRYIHQRYHAQSPQSHVEVGPMNIQSALVANATGMPQMLRATFELDAGKKTATCKFSSIDVCPETDFPSVSY